VPADTRSSAGEQLVSVNLSKGQTVSLVKSGGGTLSKVRMGLGWDAVKKKGMFGGMKNQSIDLDASCLLFDAGGHLLDQVWFQQLKSKDGAIKHTGDNLTGQGEGDDETIQVNLQTLPANVMHLVFTVNSYSGQKFNQVARAYCRLLDSGRELVRYELTEAPANTGVLMCRMSRQPDGTWTMTALGRFSDGKSVKKMVDPARAALS
jgi:tellurium resistance protein TerZ